MNAFLTFFKNLFTTAVSNPKTTIAGAAGVAGVVFPKYAPLIAAASSAAVGALAQDANSGSAPATSSATLLPFASTQSFTFGIPDRGSAVAPKTSSKKAAPAKKAATKKSAK